MTYMYQFESIADMQTMHPGWGVPVAACVLGYVFPVDEHFSVYSWDFFNESPEDWPEIVKPTHEPTDNGRWIKVDIAANVPPQVNSDWSASTGVASILNKPSLSSVATSGSYTDLTDKPSIPAGQVNSNWNAASGLAQILNKPSLAAVATSGSYVDLSNKPTIPGAVTVGSLNARTLTLNTAYQATDNTKPSIITITFTSTASLSLTAGTTVVGEIRVGTTSAVATGGGSSIATYRNSLTGTLVIGLALNTDNAQTITFALPAGGYFSPRLTSGSGLTIVSAYDQAVGI